LNARSIDSIDSIDPDYHESTNFVFTSKLQSAAQFCAVYCACRKRNHSTILRELDIVLFRMHSLERGRKGDIVELVRV
jgi:hypothetical protein